MAAKPHVSSQLTGVSGEVAKSHARPKGTKFSRNAMRVKGKERGFGGRGACRWPLLIQLCCQFLLQWELVVAVREYIRGDLSKACFYPFTLL